MSDGFRYTTAINKMRKLKKRKKAIQGSTSAGKTNGIIPILIDKAAKTARLKITVVAESIPAVKDGCVDIFKSVMQETNRWIEDHWIGNPMEYTFSNGSRIQFKSFDTVGKAKAAGKRDVLFINEGNHIPYTIADALMIRSKEIWIDYNADEEFWVHTEVLREPNSELLKLTYLDNEACPPEILEDLMIKRDKAFFNPELSVSEGLLNDENIKSAHWTNWWRIYGMGEIGTYSERSIYTFEIVKEIPPGIRRLPNGMDFGVSPDPTIEIEVYLDGVDLYLDEIFCENNLLPEKLEGAERLSIVDRKDIITMKKVKTIIPSEKFTKEDKYYLYDKDYANHSEDDKLIISEIRKIKNQMIIVDSSGRTEKSDLIKHGYDARGVNKKGGISKGIGRLRSYDIKVTSRSLNIIQGMRSWYWKVDPNGKIVPEPDGHEPDGPAAARYVMLGKPLW